MLTQVERQADHRQWRLNVVLWTCALVLLTGCHVIPMPQRRSVEELYLEALACAKPETNLGMDHPLNPGPLVEPVEVLGDQPLLTPDAAAPLPLPPQLIPPGEPSPIPLTPPASPLVPPTSTLPVPAVAPGVQPIAHAQSGSQKGSVVRASGSGSEKLVSDIYTETDVREAVQALATQAGVAIVLDDTARGAVTCTIENESFEVALQRILLPLGMVYRKKDNLYLIGSVDPTSNLFPHIAETIEYRPNHLSTQELVALLPVRQAQFVRMVDKRNLIVIEAPHDTAQQIHAQLQCADQPIPQIMIEAMVCVVAPEKGMQFGMDWNHGLQVNGLNRLNVGLSGLSFTGEVSPYGAQNAFDDFAVTSAFMKLLAKEGYVTIRAAPRVMAKDGEKAEISIARDTFFSIQQGNNQFLFNQNVQKVDSGISLTLTPQIRGEIIQIHIEKAEVSEDVRSIDPQQQLNNSPYPVINRRNVATTVQVKDQQTIVIGGLMQRQTVDRESRIPYLGAMPLVGGAFRKVEKQEQDAELAIFISPRIVVPTAATRVETFPEPLIEIPVAAPVPVVTPVEELAPPATGAVIPQWRAVPVSHSVQSPDK
jgi:type IV pilus assembly protein PilQ